MPKRDSSLRPEEEGGAGGQGGGTQEAKKPSHTRNPILAEPMGTELENSQEGKGFSA